MFSSRLTFPRIALAALALAGHSASSRAQSPALPALDGATSLLVISPHPDDETLCCAGVIQRVLRAGGRVTIVWVTSGDGSALGMLLVEKTLFDARKMREFGQSRMREARAATALLGVAPGGQLFLGYPDGAVARLLGENRALPYTSKFTDAAAVPYADALLSVGSIWIDAGESDDYYLDLGAEAFRQELGVIGVPEDRIHFELFPGTHAGIEYRYPMALSWLANRLHR